MKSEIKKLFPFYSQYHKLAFSGQYISYWDFIQRKMGGGKTYWNKNKLCTIGMPKRLYIGKCCNVIREYNFLQCSGGVYIGDYVEFATRVSLLSANHDLYDQRVSHRKPIKIGDYCWLGMHSTILAGVELGPRTIVANGAVVTKSFPEGLCILGGVPAKVIKRLDPEKFKRWINKEEYYGFIPAEYFEENPDVILNKYLDKDIFSVKNGKIELTPKYMI